MFQTGFAKELHLLIAGVTAGSAFGFRSGQCHFLGKAANGDSGSGKRSCATAKSLPGCGIGLPANQTFAKMENARICLGAMSCLPRAMSWWCKGFESEPAGIVGTVTGTPPKVLQCHDERGYGRRQRRGSRRWCQPKGKLLHQTDVVSALFVGPEISNTDSTVVAILFALS